MAVRSLGNSVARYKAVWAQTGVGAANRERYIRPFTWGGDRGLFIGGHVSGVGDSNTIGRRDLTSTGDASDFGNMTSARGYTAATNNATRAVWAGAYSAAAAIDYY